MQLTAKNRAQLLLAIALGLAMVLLLTMWLGFFNSYRQASQEIYRLQPLMARLVGIESVEQTLAEANAQAKADIARYVFPNEGSADVASAALQQKLRNLAVEQGFSVAGSQILTATEGDGFQALSINMTLNGPMASFVGLLESIALLEPVVAISSAQFSPGRSRSEEQKINARITLSALRWRP